ncbi:MAG: HAD-IB family hydrolase [Bacteroidales bacterium]|jgi:HAD superfamily hydrolase (TIGR01490 family)|nr:HAD-IB family hydrolase [Bacteroidales bacterium]
MATISSGEVSGKSYIAFFDLDGTIINAVSGTELAKGAWKRGLMKWQDLIEAIYLSLVYKFGLKDPLIIVNQMTGWVKGLPEETFEKLCFDIYNEVLLPSLYSKAGPEINMHKEKGAKVVILSSSLTPICEAIAAHLGIDDFLCSELETVDGILTGFPAGELCFGEEKLTRLRDYCEKNNSTPEEAWYYGDADSDLPALGIVGFPVCVNPERKLAKIARKNRWKIYRWT